MAHDTPLAPGYFVAIVCVVIGVLLLLILQPSPLVLFMCLFLLLLLALFLSIYFVRSWKERRARQRPLPPGYILPQQKRKFERINISSMKNYVLLVLLLAYVVFISWQVVLYIEGNLSRASSRAAMQASMLKDTTHRASLGEEKSVSKRPPLPAVHYQRPNFEAGIVFPEWSQDGYGTNWQQQLPTIQTQTGARWMEMSIFFSQATPSSTQVTTNASTPTLQSFRAGVLAARAAGYHVFVVPLLGVDSPAGQWAGTIQFSSAQDEAAWFESYWQTYRPYVVAAAQAGAEQLAIGTELVLLQQTAPPNLWNGLIARIRSVFPNALTYDLNWTSLNQPLPSWLHNADLAMIGVSEYLPLVHERIRVDPKAIFGLWKTIIRSALDKVALQLGKPIVISEIGYRNTADALYNSWLPYSTVSPPDPEEQAASCDAALANAIGDSHIVGIFFWGWDNVQSFKLSGQLASTVLKKWYTSPQS